MHVVTMSNGEQCRRPHTDTLTRLKMRLSCTPNRSLWIHPHRRHVPQSTAPGTHKADAKYPVPMLSFEARQRHFRIMVHSHRLRVSTGKDREFARDQDGTTLP
jgi:hypothetical protein